MPEDPELGVHPPQMPHWLLASGKKISQTLAVIGEEAFELIVALLVMVVVERAYGQPGLGVYAYLTACLYAARYLANYGVTRYVERETAVSANKSRQRQIIGKGTQATVITGISAALFLLATAAFDTSHTRIQERLAAYFIIAAIIPLANLNNLKLSILNGRGHHGQVVQLRMLRHGLMLVGIVVLAGIGIPPSYLLVAFFMADIAMARRARRFIKLPRILSSFKQPGNIKDTLKRGQAYLFTDNALDLLLNVDLFILGLFVTAWELGVYAEAAVMVRFFLIVPAGLKPILRRTYNQMAANGQTRPLAYHLRRNMALMFSFHAALALPVLLYFPAVMEFFFNNRLAAGQAFQLFVVFAPGLVFYGAFSAQEPIYEALGQAEALKRLTLVVGIVNFFLTLYLVPAAGLMGAAAATMMTMMVYVVLFGRKLAMVHKIDKFNFVIAGFGLYLIYTLFQWMGWRPAVTVWIGPILTVLVFYTCGIFGVQSGESMSENTIDKTPYHPSIDAHQ